MILTLKSCQIQFRKNLIMNVSLEKERIVKINENYIYLEEYYKIGSFDTIGTSRQ